MKAGPPPLRFLLLIVGGWLCARAVMLTSDLPEQAAAQPQVARLAEAHSTYRPRPEMSPPLHIGPTHFWAASGREPTTPSPPVHRNAKFDAVLHPATTIPVPMRGPPSARGPALARPPLLEQPQPRRAGGRWSGSAWAFVRQGGTSALASGGVLGGSQIGGRLSYRLNDDSRRPLQLSARFYSPLEDFEAAEISLGLEWKPIAEVPVRLLVERRQRIGNEGRSAFALLAYGGVYERPVAGPVQLDVYAQAGVVGLRRRDLFADGSLRLTAPIDSAKRAKAGIGLWGAAQPKVSRLDIGPHLSVRLPSKVGTFRLAAEWRLRVAGNASPASGPALTLSTDF